MNSITDVSLLFGDGIFVMLRYKRRAVCIFVDELLGEKTIDRIATEVGYNSVISLQRLFKKYEGVSPSEYKTMARSVEVENVKV